MMRGRCGAFGRVFAASGDIIVLAQVSDGRRRVDKLTHLHSIHVAARVVGDLSNLRLVPAELGPRMTCDRTINLGQARPVPVTT